MFFAGADGTLTAPGHVGIVVAPRHHDRRPHDREDFQVQPYGPAGLTGYTDPAAAATSRSPHAPASRTDPALAPKQRGTWERHLAITSRDAMEMRTAGHAARTGLAPAAALFRSLADPPGWPSSAAWRPAGAGSPT